MQCIPRHTEYSYKLLIGIINTKGTVSLSSYLTAAYKSEAFLIGYPCSKAEEDPGALSSKTMEGQLVAIIVCALVLAALLASADSQKLSLRLRVVSYTSDARHACIGGDVGLADTSILVQYQFFGNSTSEPSWIDMTEINPKQGLNDTLDLHLLSEYENMQLRMLQLEHGGGSCNCWSVEEALVTWNSNSVDIIHGTQTDCPRIQNLFCGGNASTERGFTRNITFQESRPTCSNGIPIFYRTQSPFTQDCSAANIKM